MTKFADKSFSSRPASDAYRENFEATFGPRPGPIPDLEWESVRIGPSQYRWLLRKAVARAKKGKRGKR